MNIIFLMGDSVHTQLSRNIISHTDRSSERGREKLIAKLKRSAHTYKSSRGLPSRKTAPTRAYYFQFNDPQCVMKMLYIPIELAELGDGLRFLGDEYAKTDALFVGQKTITTLKRPRERITYLQLIV